MDLLTRLQESGFAAWVASSPSLLAYPTILTLHTVGMAIVVGTCAVMDLRLLGIGADAKQPQVHHRAGAHDDRHADGVQRQDRGIGQQ